MSHPRGGQYSKSAVCLGRFVYPLPFTLSKNADCASPSQRKGLLPPFIIVPFGDAGGFLEKTNPPRPSFSKGGLFLPLFLKEGPGEIVTRALSGK